MPPRSLSRSRARRRSPSPVPERYNGDKFHPLLNQPRYASSEETENILGAYKNYLATKGVGHTSFSRDFVVWFHKNDKFQKVDYFVERETIDKIMKKSSSGLTIFLVSYYKRGSKVGHTFALLYNRNNNTLYNLNTYDGKLSNKLVYYFALHYDLGVNIQMEFDNQYRALNIGTPRNLATLQAPMDEFCAAWRIVLADSYVDQFLNARTPYGVIRTENIFQKMILAEPTERVIWLRYLFNRILVDKLGYMDLEDDDVINERAQVLGGGNGNNISNFNLVVDEPPPDWEFGI